MAWFGKKANGTESLVGELERQSLQWQMHMEDGEIEEVQETLEQGHEPVRLRFAL